MRLAVLVLLAALKGAPTASADLLSRPVRMTARGGLEIDLEKKVGVAREDVVLERGDVLVCCDEAEAHYSGSAIERVSCRGRVTIVRANGTRASADLAIWDAREDRVTLEGSPRLVAKDVDVTGEQIVYDIARDRLQVRGKKSHLAFSPRRAVDAVASRECPPKDDVPSEPRK